jgi:hypothetical protein
MPTVYCANEPARLSASKVEGAVALTHPFGCDEPGYRDFEIYGPNPFVDKALKLKCGL